MTLTKPNIISLVRLIISPVFYFFLISSDNLLVQIACVLFLLGALSDYLDGWAARYYKEVTAFGKFFDPLADKFLTTAAFIAFVTLHIIPLWMVVIIIFRDFGTTFLRIYADARGGSIVTLVSAKIKTTFQMIFIIILLAMIFLKVSKIAPSMDYDSIIFSEEIYYSMFVLTIITVLTLIEYVYKNRKLFLGRSSAQ